MAHIVIAGGGFGGVVAAESLAKRLGREHQITLISRSRTFVFYPALVRLAFGECKPEEIEFNVREAMLDRRIRFIEAEVARVHPAEQLLTIAHGELEGNIPYDFLVLALGRRLKTELVSGYFEHANHLLSLNGATKFGAAVNAFHKGRALIGCCPDGRLPVPVFETAFALSRCLKERGERNRCEIKVLSDESLDDMFGGFPISPALNDLMKVHDIDLVCDFPIHRMRRDSVVAKDGRVMNYDLNMIIPPFGGPGALVLSDFTDDDGFARVDHTMRVTGVDRIYAVGDCVNFEGPKMGHMAVRQAEVVAQNLAAEVRGKSPSATYDHELTLVIDAGGNESTFVQKDLWSDEPATIQHSRFWGWAKRKQEQYWKVKHA